MCGPALFGAVCRKVWRVELVTDRRGTCLLAAVAAREGWEPIHGYPPLLNNDGQLGPGVWIGWPNRLLVAAYSGWLITI